MDRLSTTVGLAACLAFGVGGVSRADEAPPGAPAAAPAAAQAGSSTEQELRDEIALLKKKLADLERRLDQQDAAKQAAPPAGAPAPQPATRPAVGLKGGKEDDEEGPPATAASVQTVTKSKLTFGGFAQIRMTDIGSQNGNRTPNSNFDFQVARFRPRLIYTHDQHWSAEVDINGTTRQDPGSNDQAVAGFSPRDMYIQWQNASIQGKIGQAKIPFGYEVYLEGDPARIEMERARILATLFPDERDIGLFFRTTPKNKGAVWGAVAVYNGNGINHDDNNTAKDGAATLKIPLNASTTVGFSFEDGNFVPATPGPAFQRAAAGMEMQYIRKRGFFKMEVLAGRNLGHDIWGGYVGGHYYTGVYGGPFFRFDTFDPNLSAAGDLWRRYAMGWYKDLTTHVRVTGEYDKVLNQLVHPPLGTDTYAVQVQTVF
jgi:hypothetical protein